MTILDRQGNVPEGLAVKTACSVATTGNITLSGLQTVDGVLLVTNQRVLVWKQTDQTTNGIYQASTGNWTRPNDANNNESFIKGTEVVVTSGTTNGNSTFIVTCADDPIVIGTSLLTWAISAVVGNGGITYAKIQNVTASRLLGNPTGSAAAPSEISLGAAFAFVGAGVLQTLAMTGDVTTVSNSFATTIAAGAVTYAKIQNVAASTLLGNPFSTAQAASEATIGTTLSFNGSRLITTSATGDVTWTSNSFATTIANAAVTLAKMSSLAASSFIGNNTGSAATPLALNTSSVAAMIASVGATVSNNPSDPSGTSSATGVMMGLGAAGCTITPNYSTRVQATMTGQMTSNTNGSGASLVMRWGTGAAPANGAAPTGTVVGGAQVCSVDVSGRQFNFTCNANITGLTPGTQIWVDLRLLALTSGTATASGISFQAREF